MGHPQEELDRNRLIEICRLKRKERNKGCMKVPKIEQPYGIHMGQIRQMGPGRCSGTVGTGFQALATKRSGADEDMDSSAHA